MAVVSVVMPVYNAMPYLPQAVESVLGQTFSDFEFIILNDASTDGSAEYLSRIRDARVRVVHCHREGLAGIANRATELAASDLVARIDADDIAAPNRLEMQLALMLAAPDLVVCGCQADVINIQGLRTGGYWYPTSDAGVRFELLSRCAFPHPGVVYRRRAALEAGGYAAHCGPSEDYDLWTRMALHGRFANCPETLLQYRVHGRNISVVQAENRDRVTREVAIRYILASGVAATPEEASRLLALKRKTHPDQLSTLTIDEAEDYCQFVERFVEAYLSGGGNDVSEVRRGIRWQFLNRAAMHRFGSKDYRQWLALARRIDPSEMSLARTAARAAAKVFRTVTGRDG